MNDVFMSIVAVGSSSKSFEEVRADDYILSYQTSGRPPLPVPQEPTEETQRKALGLPPLFKPQTEIALSSGLPGTSASSALAPSVASTSLSTSLSQNTTTKQKIVDPTSIPFSQEFKLHTIATEKYHNIVCMPEYEGFCPEELRYHAYSRGNITSPIPITMDPFNTHATEPSTTTTSPTISDETLQSQCASPEYSRHSPEELRVAWMMSGREMTSNDLLGPAVPSAPSLGAAVSSSASIPPPTIAAATPTAPKFNFVFK